MENNSIVPLSVFDRLQYAASDPKLEAGMTWEQLVARQMGAHSFRVSLLKNMKVYIGIESIIGPGGIVAVGWISAVLFTVVPPFVTCIFTSARN